MENFNLIVGVTTLITAFISIVGWIYEFKKRKKLQQLDKIHIWSQISKTKGIMNDIEKGLVNEPNDKYLLQSHAGLVMVLRDLFEKAILAEKDFSINTIELWRTSGKTSSDWQEKIVLTLADSNGLNGIKEEYKNKYGYWDELDSEHPAYSQRGKI